jgi:hypothetical protein
MIQYWLEYHAAIFGAENIGIINHDSHHNETLEIFQIWQQKGIHLTYSNASYQLKGELTHHALQSWFPDAHIYIPLDVDEFIIFYNQTNKIPQANRTAIRTHFSNLWNAQQQRKTLCWGMLHTHNSHPISINDTMETIRYFAPYTRPSYNTKKFVKNTPKFQGLDHGNHCPIFNDTSCLSCTMVEKIGLLHYHFRSPLETAKRAIVDLIGLESINKHANLDTIGKSKWKLNQIWQKQLPGKHKAKELLAYLNDGLPGMLKSMYEVYPKQGEVIDIGTIEDLIKQIKSS